MKPAVLRNLVVFPAIAVAVSVGCASASGVAPVSSRPGAASSSPSIATGKGTSAATSALDLLETIPVAKERSKGYARSKFRHWVDADGDGCDTREEVLIAESLGHPQVDAFGCKVVAGDWVSVYDGVEVSDPSTFDIDHLVALKEAWDSGAHSWSDDQRRRFANDLSDPRALVAVTASSNRSKGDRDPSQWMPPRGAHRCTYLADWVAVKAHWSLSMDQSERGFVAKRLKGECANPTTAPWGAAPVPTTVPAPVVPVTTSPSSAPTTTTAPAVSTTVGAKGAAADVKPGAFCAPAGATGNHNQIPYLCARTSAAGKPYADGRARWRRAS